MKKIILFIALATSAVCFLSCSSITKNTTLKQDAVNCGGETIVWESVPPSERNIYDVSVSFKKGPCLRRVITQDGAGKMTTNDVTRSRPQTYTGVTKIVLQCVDGELALATNCSFTVNDVERSPTNKATIITIASMPAVTVPCGTAAVGFTATNTTGADVTVLWQSDPPCNATMTAIRVGATSGKTITNLFIHSTTVDKELSTIRGVLSLTFACNGTGTSTTPGCSFQVVETEY
jgi:hypothetical protein